MEEFKVGDDYQDAGADFKAYGITLGNWDNKIEVHGDPNLRDVIIALLNGRTAKIEKIELGIAELRGQLDALRKGEPF